MPDRRLTSLPEYGAFVAEILDRATVIRSSVAVWPESPFTGTAEGEVYFSNGLRLRMREELDFEAGLITAYGYEVYQGTERLYWYDDFPHPGDPDLASTHPHHRHIPPDIKHHRVPAPKMSFTRPNLPVLVQEIEEFLKA